MDRTALLSLLPHQGQALWLEQVLDHDSRHIRGLTAWRHLDTLTNPSVACLLYEAAAQLCAAHGALYGAGKSIDAAFVGKVTAVTLHHQPPLRDQAPLITAAQEAVSPAGARYRFDIHHGNHLMADGSLLLVLLDA